MVAFRYHLKTPAPTLVCREFFMSFSFLCPYTDCENLLGDRSDSSTCICKRREPVVVCSACTLPSRSGAKFCRSCRTELPKEAPKLTAQTISTPGEFGFAGQFRRPAIPVLGRFYAVDVEGRLFSLSPRVGAQAREVARLPAMACGFNTGVVVEPLPGSGTLAGPCYLSIHPDGVEAVQLFTGTVTRLCGPKLGTTLVANASEAEANAFRGIAANNDFCTFAERLHGTESALVIQYLSSQRPAERPFILEGSSLLGPVLCEGRIVIASEDRVIVYDPQTPSTWEMQLPGGFSPLFKRSTRFVNVPLGSTPITVALSDAGVEVWIVGSRSGEYGLLHLNLSTKVQEFTALPEGSSVASNPDGTLCVCTVRELSVLGGAASTLRSIPIHASLGMPVYLVETFTRDAKIVCYYSQYSPQDQFAVHMIDGHSAEPLAEFRFHDPVFNQDSCCGTSLLGRHLFAQSLSFRPSAGGYGLRLTHWETE
jgi:hypothetical protein